MFLRIMANKSIIHKWRANGTTQSVRDFQFDDTAKALTKTMVASDGSKRPIAWTPLVFDHSVIMDDMNNCAPMYCNVVGQRRAIVFIHFLKPTVAAP